MSLLAELNRRNVIRVGIAYSVVAWLIAQVAEFAFETFGTPDWALKSVVVLLLLGLPVVLVFAWAFEITPEGIRLEKNVDRSQSITAHTGRKLDRAIIVGLVVVGLLIIARPWLPSPAGPPSVVTPNAPIEDSVAVLPFVDLSPDGDQEYFSDGISEEILNALVRIPGLKVAGRTSSFSYKDKGEDLRTISAALGVDHLLEGSVRRAGDQIRITAQLIRGEDGFHLWSETYDRNLSNIFAVQEEIARSVAEQLTVSLGLEHRTLVTNRTDDLVAYENYLRARELHLARGRENLELALLLLQEAAARDPEFAPTWIEFAGIYANFYAYQEQETRYLAPRWRAIGMAAAERAIELSPADGVAHAYLGVFKGLDNRWIEAFRAFDRAADLAPNNPIVLDTIAQQMAEVGYFREMLELSERAVSLDPLVAIYRNTYARALAKMGDYDRAIDEYETAIELDPLLRFPLGNLALLYGYLGNIDDMSATILKGIDSGAFPESLRKGFLELPELVGDQDAARAWIESDPQARNSPSAWLAIVDDQEAAMDALIRRWGNEFRSENFLFPRQVKFIFSDPRWKAQIRREGILELWRSRGFPEWCRPLDEDDFECTPH